MREAVRYQHEERREHDSHMVLLTGKGRSRQCARQPRLFDISMKSTESLLSNYAYQVLTGQVDCSGGRTSLIQA